MALFSRKRAILIGADKYEHVTPLEFCGADVRDVAEVFRKSLEFKPQDVLEFTVSSPVKPERSEIIHQLGKFLSQPIAEDELLVFYFSGHGMISEADHKDYLLPVDASPTDLPETGISVEYVANRLRKTGCKNIVMFIDACRETVSGEKGIQSVGEFSKEALTREGIVTFFSCDPKEKSYEISDLKHGSFTHCILDSINKGACDTVESIDKYLRENVPTLNSRYQKPAQRPFTIIEPAEKSKLQIFYRTILPLPASNSFGILRDRLIELFFEEAWDEKSFSDAVDLTERADNSSALTTADLQRLKFVELLCDGKFSRGAFRHVWAAAERRTNVPLPPKTLKGIE